jgi:hypothetical protein
MEVTSRTPQFVKDGNNVDDVRLQLIQPVSQKYA